MAFRVIPLLAALVLGAGCMAPVDTTGEVAQDIIGGNRIPGQYLPAVIILARDGAGRHIYTCSGSLITPRVVMTAGHCSTDAASWDVHFADKYDLKTKTFSGEIDDVLRSAQVVWTNPLFNESRLDLGHDIALFYLDKPAPASVTPFEFNRYRMNNTWIGKPLRMIGFGLTVAGGSDYGEKLEGLGAVSTILTEVFQSNGLIQTCQGDSGGPILISIEGREIVAGITSFGFSGCSGDAGYTRVDVERQNILDFISQHDPQSARDCGADGKCGVACGAPDPDCPCAQDGFCPATCTEPDIDPDCATDCLRNGVCQRGKCPTKDPDCGDKTVGAACTGNAECSSGLCVPSGGDKVCAEACDSQGKCGSGFTCTANVCLEDGGGGGCQTGGGGASSPAGLGGWLALGLAWLLARRRLFVS